MPELYIITGSNGAGKSSMGKDFLPEYITSECEIFDGDKLYMQKHSQLWRSGIRVNKQIRELANNFVNETFSGLVEKAIKNNTHFCYEGHFTEEESWSIPIRFKEQGYIVNMIFFGLNNTDESELRVLERVNDGGHNVPRLMIENNFYGNLDQLNRHFSLFHSLRIFDTSTLQPLLLYEMVNGICSLNKQNNELPAWFTVHLPDLIPPIR